MRISEALLILSASICISVALPVLRDGRQDRNKLLLISFDGFRWDYDQDVDTPHFDALSREGVKAKYITPAFVTMTSPSHFTIVTGRYIENHGVIHNMWFNPETGAMLPYYPTQGVSEWWDNGTLPIWITAQMQGLKTGSFHFPSGNATYGEKVVYKKKVEPGFYNYSNETTWQENINVVMKWFTEEQLDFVALYFGEPDGAGHKHGPDSQKRKDMVMQVDRTVGYLMSCTERYGLKSKLNIIITADHGMRTVLKKPEVKEIILSKIANFSFKDLSFSIVDYGPNAMLLPKKGRVDKVYQALYNGHPNLKVYKKEDFPRRFHYANHPRILPILLYSDPGYVIHGRIPLQFNKGEHGFDNNDMDMKTIFRATGPDFKKNLVAEPFENVHIYALMCELLGITPAQNDGSLEVTKHMLNYKTTDSQAPSSNSEFKRAVGLWAVVGVLMLIF
ncbi:ectonucleotide pyrophosphatase/phosphodiesterase family member 7 [Latimeria chalumnae]|uniref:ectonucleotide pyrophosphatase/phosphodiesterase family member 7 n=1 Tax=Latimeria chalumnae TaxID=7897 RepID=UPI0006D90A0F|nr:PREDICTED: ectonucleotide pyrophosphatase/phosphodiesterase family member 7 [Latimeria chalumnae]|eukprot:XP_014340012.1 PREDICTED: ectonucleotide pyrophosphatase/phosphodiesterase family member 7 [Latimeria chalumnae]